MGKKWDTETGPGEKLLRLFSLLLFTQERYSLGVLAETLECSKQTVLRLIDQIEATGWAKVQRGESGRKALYWIERPNNLPRIALNPEGLEQLALCRNFLEHMLPCAVRASVDATLQQATAYVSEADAANMAAMGKLGAARTKGRIDYSRVQPLLQILLRAASGRTVCEITYRSSLFKEPRTFDFAPLRLVAYHESLYVVGWEVTDKGIAAPVRDEALYLLAHRLTDAKATRRTWKVLPEVKGHYVTFGIMRQEPFTVRMRISTPEAVTYVAERCWSEDQQTLLHDDGSLTLTMTAQSGLEVMSWALSLGSAAEVLEPEWLRNEIKAEAVALAEIYGISQ
ncbi:MAG: WYL domain-containing protein [Desulfovibrio sp.]|jgi:predicted DNA-binding transcriptional regulator YafY|nr:WYL domain-containing protein [Desulfovibrio sp.]